MLITDPDERDLDLPSTEEVLCDHHRSKASFPLRVLITLMVIGMIGLGAAGYLLFESQRSVSISTAENADRLSAIASLEAKQNELVALVNSHTGKLATQGDAINELRLATAPLLSRQTRISTSALIAELNVLLRTAVLALSLNGDTTLAAELLDEAIRMIAAESLPGLADLKAALLMIEPRCVIFPVLIPPRPISCLNRRGSGSLHCRFDHLGIEILQEREGGQAPLATGSWESFANRLLAQLSSLVDFRRNEMPIQLPPPMTSPCWCSDNCCYFSQLNWHCCGKIKWCFEAASKKLNVKLMLILWFARTTRVAIDHVLENDFHRCLAPNY